MISTALCASAITAHSAISVTAVGDGTGYDILGDGSATNEATAYRSTGVVKTFDNNGDNVYGTNGVFVFGDGTTNNNGQPFGLNTQVGLTYTSVTSGADVTSVATDPIQGPMDDPTQPIGVTVSDFGFVGFATVPSGGAGNWGEVLEFTITADMPQLFRIGLIAGTQAAANGRWDPTGLRITDGEGNAFASVTGLENAGTGGDGAADRATPNWVFFDVDLDGATSGKFGIETQQRLSTQGGGFTGFTIDAVPEPSTTALLGLGGLALIMRRRK
ncbi:hypothetical protein NT6N_22490 [Oceaniferula spumae]|uniref:Ice-binding protein C-terminal domain-containing protein n=1 Tax=Oceaniferula spumae TaxID=2979115 RepID=A0AAT9FMH8_9BACT